MRQSGAIGRAAIVVAICVASAVVPPDAAHGAQPTGTTLIETGTLEHFDSTSSILTVTTVRGEQRFTIGAKARLREGNHKIDAAALSGLTGRDIRVRYVEAAGRKTVRSVTVSAAGRRRDEM